MLLISTFTFAQTVDADKIIGSYMTERNKGKVTIAKKGIKYYDTSVWIKESGALDRNNPDEKERKNKVAGKIILKDLAYTGNGTWEKGTVYDPESGKTYIERYLINCVSFNHFVLYGANQTSVLPTELNHKFR